MDISNEYRHGEGERVEQVDGKLWNIVSEIFCIFYAYIYEPQESSPRSNSGIMMPCLFPPAALSMALYQMLIINRCYFLPY